MSGPYRGERLDGDGEPGTRWRWSGTLGELLVVVGGAGRDAEVHADGAVLGTLVAHPRPAWAEALQAGVTTAVDGAAVRLARGRPGLLRRGRAVAVERAGRGAAQLRIRGYESVSLEREGAVLVRGRIDAGTTGEGADRADVAVFLLAEATGLTGALLL